MPAEERAARLARLRTRVSTWTADAWLSAQLAELGMSAASLGLPLSPASPTSSRRSE
jgi:hypothetical protein